MSYEIESKDRPIAFPAEELVCECGHPADCEECGSCGDHCHLNEMDELIADYQEETVLRQIKEK